MSLDLRQPITAGQIADYRRDGAVCLRQVFDRDWVELLRRGLARNVAAPTEHFRDFSPEGASGGFITDMWAWRSVPEYEEFIRKSPVGELGGLLNQTKRINFVEDNFFIKRPGVQAPTPWHQDQPYYEIEGLMFSVWIPLDNYAKADCLEFVAGSHLLGKKFLPVDFAPQQPGDSKQARKQPPAPYELIPDIDADRDAYPILSWEMNLGDCVVFSGMTVHGNRGNDGSTGGRRISFRFVGDNAIYAPNEHIWAQLGMDHGLAPGQSLACAAFPTIWTQAAPNAGAMR